MSIFSEYSKYYDLLYQDKDYAAEVEYLNWLIQENSAKAKTILNLGCGSGRHDFLLAEKGYNVTGVDLSEEMIAVANKNSKGCQVEHKPEFFLGDIRTKRLNRHYDVVTALFHVMSYQVTNDDLDKAFETAYEHLQPRGIFIFDCWYGPGVITDRPHIREKQLESEILRVNRKSTPVIHPNEDCVDVIYDLVIENKITNEVYNITETHKMRYLFLPELQYFLERKGFKFKKAFEWMTEYDKLDFTSWYAVIICSK